MELQCAKEDGYLPALSYLDTALGIEPIVAKLPIVANFTRFVCYEKRNNPSFALPSDSGSPVMPEKPFFKGIRNSISFHKPNVFWKGWSTNSLKKSVSNSNKSCPIHYKPHPFKRCKAIRAKKNLKDRKTFLEEIGNCFGCCGSTTQLARECATVVKHIECDSAYHNTAMHTGPSPQVMVPSTSLHNGKEGEESNDIKAIVNLNCTKVCCAVQVNQSCSKICLTKVYRRGQTDKAIKAYIILDAQSNRSLARSSFFELFKDESYSYYLRTCPGTMETSGKRAEDFVVESLNWNVTILLPPLIECKNILKNQSKIPTQCAALHQPYLVKVVEHLPEVDPSAEILLLVGRDINRLHKVWELVNGEISPQHLHPCWKKIYIFYSNWSCVHSMPFSH